MTCELINHLKMIKYEVHLFPSSNFYSSYMYFQKLLRRSFSLVLISHLIKKLPFERSGQQLKSSLCSFININGHQFSWN